MSAAAAAAAAAAAELAKMQMFPPEAQRWSQQKIGHKVSSVVSNDCFSLSLSLQLSLTLSQTHALPLSISLQSRVTTTR